MFKIIKENVDILEAISKELGGIEFKKIGEDTYEPIDKQCPFCGHKDCFRVYTETKSYHCFSGGCEVHGDVINFVGQSRKIKPVEAARALAREWKVQLPNDYTPVQEIFNLTALYYHTCLKETCNRPFPELNGLTPLEFQLQTRRHKLESIDHFKIGWSDGGLITYLKGLGFEDEIVSQTGLMNKKGKDFLPAKAFMYPHYVRGKVSHFTFKDPLKQNEYQLKNVNKLNNHLFYNSDSLLDSTTVAIVEGENDLISVHENGWTGGLIATIGQLSSSQLEWMVEGLANKDVVTLFDTDQAGDKYREKVHALKNKFKSLIQVKLIGAKDIDEYLVKGNKLETAIAANNISQEFEDLKEQTPVDAELQSNLNITEQNGSYYKIKYVEGQPKPIKLTNFVIRLKNVYIKGSEREREVIIEREDGQKSSPVLVTSDCKVSLKTFKTFVANAVDGSYYGQEGDLTAIWEYAYSKGTEKKVYVPTMVGRQDQFKGWLFRDLFISDTGLVTRPDEENIIWFADKTTGLKAMSLSVGEDNKAKNENIDIPTLISTDSEEERRTLLKGLVDNLCKNLGDVGMALTLLGWAKANVYSDAMFHKVQGFPFLFFWGKHGQGKTVIAKWIASIFSMDECGYATLPQYRSGVGFGRKIAYYASLPVIMDEIRADNSTTEQYGVFRSWYQRAGRILGTKEGFGIKVQQVRSNFIFVGQDQFTDGAARQRCIPVRIPISGRDKEVAYKWIEQRKGLLNSIGYHWILESTRANTKALYEQYERLDKQLVENGCEARSAKNWACIGVFAKSLCDEFIPGFNYYEYIFRVSKTDSQEEQRDDIVAQFFAVVEGMYASENCPFNGEHIRTENGELYVWFEEVFRLVQREYRGITKENFSERAVREALKEEPYFVTSGVKRDMGLNKTRHRVYVLNLKHEAILDSLYNIGQNSAR